MRVCVAEHAPRASTVPFIMSRHSREMTSDGVPTKVRRAVEKEVTGQRVRVAMLRRMPGRKCANVAINGTACLRMTVRGYIKRY